jgi:hypothetical protein
MNPPDGGETSSFAGDSIPLWVTFNAPPGRQVYYVSGTFLIEPWLPMDVGSDWCTVRGSSCVADWEQLGAGGVSGAANITLFEPGRYKLTLDVRWADDREKNLGTKTLTHTLDVIERPGNICLPGLLDWSNLPGQSPDDARFGTWLSKFWTLWRWSGGLTGGMLLVGCCLLPFVITRLGLQNSDHFEGIRPSYVFFAGLLLLWSLLAFLGYYNFRLLAAENEVAPQLKLESPVFSRGQGYLVVSGAIINENRNRPISWRSDFGRGREVQLLDKEGRGSYYLIGVAGKFGSTYKLPPGVKAHGAWYFAPEQGTCPSTGDEPYLGGLQLSHPRLPQLTPVGPSATLK